MTREFGPESFPIIYKLDENGQPPEEIRHLVKADNERKRKIEEFESSEPFIQDLKKIAEVTREKGRDYGEGFILESENYPFLAPVRRFDKYARVAEKMEKPEGTRANSRMDLDYGNDLYTALRIYMPNYIGWETLEEPGESERFPDARKGLSKGDWYNTLSIEGPADSLGPNTLRVVRRLTGMTLASLS